MGTHNLCFGAKITKIGIPLHNPVFLCKMGYMGVYISRTCFRDEEGGRYYPWNENLRR